MEQTQDWRATSSDFLFREKSFLGFLSDRNSHRQLDLYDLTHVILMSMFIVKGDGSQMYAIESTVNSKDSALEASLAKFKF